MKFCLFVALIFFVQGARAQQTDTQYEFVKDANQQARLQYSSANVLTVYHGTHYDPAYTKISSTDVGDPFYLRSTLRNETLVVRGIAYTSVPLIFDLMQNKIVSEMPGSGIKISLVKEHIDRFTLDGHTFVNIRDSAIHQSDFAPGFYDMLYSGNKMNVYARRTKELSESTIANAIVRKYKDKSKVYVLKNGRYFVVRRKKTLMALVGDKRSGIESLIRQEKIRFTKDNFEAAVVRISEAYDKL